MGGGGSKTPANTTNVSTLRYAAYIETRHQDFLNTIYARRQAAINQSPFAAYVNLDVDDAFFGAGYMLSSFPSLYDMFGKFMAGLDVETLWSQIFDSTVNSSVVTDLVAAESALLEDDLETNAIPALQVGMRDVNSVMSSSYPIGRALIEDSKSKMIAKFSAELKYRLIPVVQDRYQAHLNWNKLVVGTYAEIIKFYYAVKTDVDEINYTMAAKDTLWPFTVLDFERAALGALQGATNSKTDVAGGPSTISRMLGGALSGAAMGAMVGSQISGQAGSIGVTGGTTAGVNGATTTTAGSYAGGGAVVGAVLGAAAAYTY